MLNIYNSIKQPATTGFISVDNWLSKIQTSEFSSTINKARNGLIDYNKTKASLPAVTWNFNFIDYKSDANCIYSTNHIFIDIDDSSFDIKSVDKTKVFAFYKSFGGSGYGLIVKTKGITYYTFKTAYMSICSQLGIEKYIDKNF